MYSNRKLDLSFASKTNHYLSFFVYELHRAVTNIPNFLLVWKIIKHFPQRDKIALKQAFLSKLAVSGI